MKCEILKAFSYSADGVETLAMKPGMEFDIREDVAPGLVDGGFVKAKQVVKPEGKVSRDTRPELATDSAESDTPTGAMFDANPIVTPAHTLQNPEVTEAATLVDQKPAPIARPGRTR